MENIQIYALGLIANEEGDLNSAFLVLFKP
jgi:hypothetical protein